MKSKFILLVIISNCRQFKTIRSILYTRVAILLLLYCSMTNWSIKDYGREISIYESLFDFFKNSNILCTLSFISRRFSSSIGVVPVVSYNNADEDKKLILKENRGKSGIYRLTNKINGKCYIGSAVNLTRRFSDYYSEEKLKNYLKNYKSKIYSAILKYGHLNFKLDILEYCDEKQVIDRENFYIKFLKPEYNILLVAGSSLGFRHSKEAI